jgi:hypothetical protein
VQDMLTWCRPPVPLLGSRLIWQHGPWSQSRTVASGFAEGGLSWLLRLGAFLEASEGRR